MYEKIYSNPDIYKFYVPLTNNPLKYIICYVIKTDEKNLIIDTGFNMPECYKALSEGLKELNVDISKTALFITHLHSDHIGLAPFIMNSNSTIYMSKIDYDYLNNESPEYSWEALYKKYISEGFPKNEIVNMHITNPAEIYAPEKTFKAVTVNDGDKIKIGSYTLECVFTPGHTPGHTCIYIEDKEIMFLGDHVLFDITPNITFWTGIRDSLKDYINSLIKIKTFKIKTALPAHRENSLNFYDRVEQILNHHENRLDECFNILKSNPGLSAYDTASFMKWSMRGKDWSEFPMHQKWFAVGETIAHLDNLKYKNKIYRRFQNGVYCYYTF